MATARQYAEWCLKLIEGEDYLVDEILEAMYDDGFIDADQEWLYDEDDDE